MSAYTLDYLRDNTLVGDVETNGLPWTARALDVGISDKNSDGRIWLWNGKVPLKRVKELFASFDVGTFPSGFIREATPGDTGLPTFTGEDGLLYVFVRDARRQAVADKQRDFVHFVPKAGYKIHGFTETLVSRTARIVGDSDGSLHIDSAGVLANGGEAWVSIATGSLLTLPEGVSFYPHVLASSSHTGTLATSLQAVNTMTVCDNTRAAALGEGRENGTVTKARHSKRSESRLADDESEARTVMGLIETASEDFAATVKHDCEIPVTENQWSDFLDSIAPIDDEQSKHQITRNEKLRDEVSAIWSNDDRNQWQGTAFGALQAINTFDLWERQAYAGTDHYARNMRDTITGKADMRESERRSALMEVLAN